MSEAPTKVRANCVFNEHTVLGSYAKLYRRDVYRIPPPLSQGNRANHHVMPKG